MAAIPFRTGIMHAGARDGSLPAEGCRRCGMSEVRCSELHGQRKALKPFERVHGERDTSMCVCYWCQREWEVFWQSFRPDVCAFYRALPFMPARRSEECAARGGSAAGDAGGSGSSGGGAADGAAADRDKDGQAESCDAVARD
jgi:hypothetical protein